MINKTLALVLSLSLVACDSNTIPIPVSTTQNIILPEFEQIYPEFHNRTNGYGELDQKMKTRGLTEAT